MQIRANPYLKKINLRERRFKRQETRFNCSFFGQFPCSWIRIRFPSLRIRIQDSKISADLCESIPVFDIKKPSRTKVQKASTTLFFLFYFHCVPVHVGWQPWSRSSLDWSPKLLSQKKGGGSRWAGAARERQESGRTASSSCGSCGSCASCSSFSDSGPDLLDSLMQVNEIC
jgi:hypothetical protein